MSTEPKETTMTDQTAHDVTPEDMEHARSYVRHFLDATHGPDHTRAVARVLQALLPPPPRPTLADMTDEEREACRWMQADSKTWGRVVITVPNLSGARASLLDQWGDGAYEDHARITPRRDLRRMEWPGDKKPAPAPAPALPKGWRLADHPEYGRVIVTNPTPSRNGRVYFVLPADRSLGYGCDFCTPDELTYIDGPEATAPVPPSTLAEGSEWDDADALALACRESGRDQIVVTDKDGDVFVWDEMAEWWESPMPPRRDPYTILHTGKKADQ